ncbi:uncharacterized protein, partial [Temnothorax nylanderi]|uniref:uncharacterized protein n=1 Tax=Temnothorax nylanderi TaxID=102681 RepID=UPI003A860BDA
RYSTSDNYELPEIVNLDTAASCSAQGFISPSKLSSSYLCNDSLSQRLQSATCILLEDASILNSDSSDPLTENNIQISNENSDESNLKKYLQETSEVRLIIKAEKDRILSRISVTEKLINFVITTFRFQKLAGDIVKIFKGESCNTYYTPFTCKNGVRIQASEDKLQWLFQHTEPWEQVYEYWNNTYRARNKLLMQDKLNVLEYFNKFPCLRLNKGQQLVTGKIYV